MSSRRKAVRMNFSKNKGKPKKPNAPVERKAVPKATIPVQQPVVPVVDPKLLKEAIAKDEWMALTTPTLGGYNYNWELAVWAPEKKNSDRLVAKAADQKHLVMFESKMAASLYTVSEIKAGLIDGLYLRGSVLNEKPLRAEDYFNDWTSSLTYQVPPGSMEFARVIQHARDLFGGNLYTTSNVPEAIYRVQNRKLWTRHVKSGTTKLLMHGTSQVAADCIVKEGFLRSKLVSAQQFYFSSNARVCTSYFKTHQPALVLAEVSNTQQPGPVFTCTQENEIYPAWIISMRPVGSQNTGAYTAYYNPATRSFVEKPRCFSFAKLFFFALVVGLLAWWFWTHYYAPKPAVALMP